MMLQGNRRCHPGAFRRMDGSRPMLKSLGPWVADDAEVSLVMSEQIHQSYPSGYTASQGSMGSMKQKALQPTFLLLSRTLSSRSAKTESLSEALVHVETSDCRSPGCDHLYPLMRMAAKVWQCPASSSGPPPDSSIAAGSPCLNNTARALDHRSAPGPLSCLGALCACCQVKMSPRHLLAQLAHQSMRMGAKNLQHPEAYLQCR